MPLGASAQPQPKAGSSGTIVLRAARLLDVETGKIVSPGEVLVRSELIAEAASAVTHPSGAEVIDLGDRTLLPGLIDAHVHLFLHPGAEDLQTVEESTPQRTILAVLAAREDLMAGFTAERDMGTEGAGSAEYGGAKCYRSGLDSGTAPPHQRKCRGHPRWPRGCH